MDAWTDGSNKADEVYGFGCVIVDNDVAVHEAYKAYNNESHRKYRNVSGEVMGVIYALNYALQTGAKELNIYYDYTGLENWATGVWKAGNVLSQEYVRLVRAVGQYVDIKFHKVKAHTGVTFNERADELAKLSIKEWLDERNS